MITKLTGHSLFVKCLREDMEHFDVTQADLARTLEVSQAYISDVLLERRGPLSIEAIITLHRVYKFHLHRLLSARAWTLRKVDLPQSISYQEVEQIVGRLVQRGVEG